MSEIERSDTHCGKGKSYTMRWDCRPLFGTMNPIQGKATQRSTNECVSAKVLDLPRFTNAFEILSVSYKHPRSIVSRCVSFDQLASQLNS
jgi:hypothetical protein